MMIVVMQNMVRSCAINEEDENDVDCYNRGPWVSIDDAAVGTNY